MGDTAHCIILHSAPRVHCSMQIPSHLDIQMPSGIWQLKINTKTVAPRNMPYMDTPGLGYIFHKLLGFLGGK